MLGWVFFVFLFFSQIIFPSVGEKEGEKQQKTDTVMEAGKVQRIVSALASSLNYRKYHELLWTEMLWMCTVYALTQAEKTLCFVFLFFPIRNMSFAPC